MTRAAAGVLRLGALGFVVFSMIRSNENERSRSGMRHQGYP